MKFTKVQELREEVAREMLYQIALHSKKKEINAGEVEKVARKYIEGDSAKDMEEFMAVIYEATKDFWFLLSVYAKYKGILEEDKTENALRQAREYMQTGDIDKALIVMKGGQTYGI